MFKGEIRGEKENTVIRGPREGLRVHNTQGLFTVWPSSCQTPLQEKWPLAGCLCLLFLLSWEQCKSFSPCCQTECCCSAGLSPSQACTSHTPFTAQQEPATGGASKCQALKLLCQKTNENISQWLQRSYLFPVFLLRLCTTNLCSYKFSSCMAPLQAHWGYLHTPTIFTRVLWRSKRQNQTKPCNKSVPEMVINPDSLLSFSFLLGRQCCLLPLSTVLWQILKTKSGNS